MTVTPSVIYLIGILDKFHLILGLILAFLSISFAIYGIYYIITLMEPSFVEERERLKKNSSIMKRILSVLSILLLLKIFVPSTGLLASMYIIPAVVNNEKVQNIGSNLLGTLESLSQKWMIDVFEGIEIDKKESKKSGNSVNEKDRSI